MSALPDAEQLLTLLAVAEEGNESAAALRLGIGQSSVSRRLAALQALTPLRLTQRTAAGTRLTPEGMALLGSAREVRAALRAAAERLDPSHPATPRVRLGISPHLVNRFAGSLCTEARAASELVEAHSAELLRAVRRGELPAALSLAAPAGGEPGLAIYPVGVERLVLASQPGDARLKEIGSAAAAHVRLLVPAPPSEVGERAELLLRRAGLAGVERVAFPSPAALRAAVLAGAGIGVALASELDAEAAAGWLTLAPFPSSDADDAALPVWLLVSDDAPGEERASLEALAAELAA